MTRHRLRVFQRSAALKVGRDAGRVEGVAADLHPEVQIGGTALDHTPGIDSIHRFIRQFPSAAGGGAEEGGLAGVADAGGLYI